MDDGTAERLIENINNGTKKIHYLPGFPQLAQEIIIDTIEREWDEDVQRISSVVSWDLIKASPEKIKIVKRAAPIIDKFGLNGLFNDLERDGASYVLFVSETYRFKKQTHEFQMVEYVHEKADNLVEKYEYFEKERIDDPGEQLRKKIDKWCMRIANNVSVSVMIVFVLVYICGEFMETDMMKSLGKLGFVLAVIGKGLGLANMFNDTTIFKFATRKVKLPFYFFLRRKANRRWLKESG